MEFKSITIALDMFGCPNRCKHCWIGHSPNGHLSTDDLRFVADQFRPFTNCLEVYDWYREPDYKENYRELWKLRNTLSNIHTAHFELVSVWRIVRDKEYVKWLSSLGLQTAQLTIFGGQEKTDFYTGRKNAYAEILEAIEILLQNEISPRLQVFINQDNLNELPMVSNLITQLDLENRCKAFGGKFACFLHQGSCDGENEKLYDIRITPDDLQQIPPTLMEYTYKYFCPKNIVEIFGETEQSLYNQFLQEHSTASYVNETPVFYIDPSFNVYPNLTAPAPSWLLGNLKTDGIQTVLENYTESKSLAQHTRLTIPLCQIVQAEGNDKSLKLFTKNDYIIYLLNKYCRK